MIIDKHKCVFVHIPKCAGTSIEQTLEPTVDVTSDKNLVSFVGWDVAAQSWLQHATMAQMNEQCERVKKYFKFTFVRNPWDRVVSLFEWQKDSIPRWKNRIRRNKRTMVQRGIYKYMYNLPPAKQTLKEFVLEPICADPAHLIDQYEFTHDKHGNQIVDFVGRYENLQEDFDKICERLGIERTTLKHQNKLNKRKNYKEYYDDETREMVAQKFAKEINSFGYEFE